MDQNTDASGPSQLRRNMWESPKYRFRVPVDPDDDGHGPLKEVVIDVTSSAPAFSSPGDRLGGVLQKLLADYATKNSFKVLDLGAGKLRNTVHVLKERVNSHVWAVEYESLRASSEQARDFYKRAKGFKSRFHDLSFPHQFVTTTETFDVILLVNVLSIMPVPAERLLLLKYCFNRLKLKGKLLWYSQHGEPDYAVGGARCNDKTSCGDGFHIGDNKYEKTFFREFQDYEVDEMMLAVGFYLENTYPVSRNLARVYEKRPPGVLTDFLKPSEIATIAAAGAKIPDPETFNCRVVQRVKALPEVRPDVDRFDIDSLCAERLQEIAPGNASATAFHRLAELILRRAFRRALVRWETEKEINSGRKRVDLLAKNRAEEGFFRRVRDHFNIYCPYVFIECKNYTDDIGNEELDQLAGRLNPKRGTLGILVCRSAEDSAELLKRTKDLLPDGKYVVVLTDEDMLSLSESARADDIDSINELMEDKLDSLLL